MVNYSQLNKGEQFISTYTAIISAPNYLEFSVAVNCCKTDVWGTIFRRSPGSSKSQSSKVITL